MSENERFAPPGREPEPAPERADERVDDPEPLVAPDPNERPARPHAEPYGGAPASPASPSPASPSPAPPTRSGQPMWMWVALVALALAVGIGGGFLGATLEDAADDPSVAGATGTDPGRVDPAPLPGENDDVTQVADTLLPSTVQILAEANGIDNAATGSGFVFDADGTVITNNHVVADSATDNGPITVIDHEGTERAATVVGRSEVFDLAVLRMRDADDLRPAALGTSSELRVGESVVAIGSPLGLSSTVTVGIVSALHRPVSTGDAEDSRSFIDAVQTDAAINPGNSGGPLVNLGGQVIGVNSAIATAGGNAGNIGVGFAIPIDQVKVTANQIIQDGHATYAVLGAEVDTRPATSGARIRSVQPGGPAARAGLRTGDTVTAVDDTRVPDGVSLIVAVRTHQPGDRVELAVERGGQERTVTVRLGAQRE